MENTAKISVQCDFCKTHMNPMDNIDGEHLEAKLIDTLGEAKNFHLCSEKCLMDLLAKRHETKKQKKKKSKASYANGCWEIEITT